MSNFETGDRKHGYHFTFALHTMLREKVPHEKTVETKKPLITLWNALLAREGIVAYLPIIVATMLMFWGASWQFLATYRRSTLPVLCSDILVGQQRSALSTYCPVLVPKCLQPGSAPAAIPHAPA